MKAVVRYIWHGRKYHPLRLMLLLDSALAGSESILQLDENGSLQHGGQLLVSSQKPPLQTPLPKPCGTPLVTGLMSPRLRQS